MSRSGLWYVSAGLALVLAWWLSPPAQALQSDEHQPLEIEAASAEFRNAEQTAVYRGDVEAVRGSQHLTGDELTVELRDGVVWHLVAVGHPATFRMLHDDGEELRAQAARLDYQAARQRLILTGDARVTKGEKTIEAQRIVYHVDTGAAEAEAPAGERVRTILVPKVQEQATP